MAPNVANLAELKVPGTFCVRPDGLNTPSVPQQVSYNQDITMPFKGAKVDLLNLYNIMLVTQKNATTTAHKKAYQEVVRVDGIAKSRRGALGDEIAEFLLLLEKELLGKGMRFAIKLTHPYFPVGYFLSMSPRYMDQNEN